MIAAAPHPSAGPDPADEALASPDSAAPILPAGLLQDTLEFYLAGSSRTGRAVYVAILVTLAGLAAALPLVRVPVAVRATGMLRPVAERQEVRAAVSGIVEEVRAREGSTVRAGDLLLTLRNDAAAGHLRAVRGRMLDIRRGMADLRVLTTADPQDASVAGDLASAAYRRAWIEARAALAAESANVARASADAERTAHLAAAALAPPAELEARRTELAEAQARWELVAARYRTGWSAELATLRTELAERSAELAAAEQEAELFSVRAPADGTVQELEALTPGSGVAAGQRLAVLSPDTTLVAELLVPPRDVGLLRVGMPVRLLVDAFDYRDWGAVPARIDAIASDIVVSDGRPAFRVRCPLTIDRLRARTGAIGRLRKGMTLDARILLARRTLLQLLRDRATDWLEPTPAAPERRDA